ncbi:MULTISPECIES: N-acetyltransferase [Pelosinus]|jgi:putative acetyltransferase|uniref:GCN5-related N-acetyltransferase n=1 Tax=Pelosinus fermentans B4 TaxID=1149862 RepID=I9B0W9_9FIRM|nr:MULTISPECIES: N-acetyltransferase [Pelosinus]MDF2596947.1 GCN5-related N-acetyltransferase [Clostridia bacterium]EIW18787.1 GCN5-related N-acetyltransferase [Pelosinus fermentans B4]EIW22003.1 GCN5-related N-acetyltransferase [Pelosinus fermentans A11]OAM95145.1 GCN5-related N-acetyltransferase [Pelosinus fermentans DSM 17108]SDR23926.1 putative acetyltransferase [Pelosinus fermentans]
MIKEFEKSEIDEVMNIWLATNINAHNFLPEKYWIDNYNVVKEQYLPISETFVYKEDSVIKGFISIINNSFIGALFVAKEYQGQGIGLKLINHCKSLYPKLELAVYVDNIGAVDFYKRCGFEFQTEQVNEDSAFREYIMFWNRMS